MAFQNFKYTRIGKSVLLLLVVAVIIAQCGCAGNDPDAAISYGEDYLLNTHCAITIYEEGQEALIKEALTYARSLENLLSRTISSSDIGRFNAMDKAEAMDVSKATAAVVERGLQYGAISGGLFDITVGTLTELWDFSAAKPLVPEADAINEAIGQVDYKGVQVRKDDRGAYFLTKENPNTRIDLGGIAKGYIADRVFDFLKDKGVSLALINFGGNILTLGQKQDGSLWNIGLEKPFSSAEGDSLAQRELIGMLSFEGGSIVTSGTYERKFYENGQLYYHILDPQTGYPRVTDLVSVTIIGPSSTECDALSTVCLMLGLDEGRSLIESIQGYEAVFITDTETIVSTSDAVFMAY